MTTKFIVMAGFLMSFAAGLVTGLERHQTTAAPARPTTRQSDRRGASSMAPQSFWIQQLTLTPEQQKKWTAIWSAVASRGGQAQDDHRRQLRFVM